jgi:hypothetical protein
MGTSQVVNCSSAACACVIPGTVPVAKDRWRLEGCIFATGGYTHTLSPMPCPSDSVTWIAPVDWTSIKSTECADACRKSGGECRNVVPIIYEPPVNTETPTRDCSIVCADGTAVHSDRGLTPLMCAQLRSAVCGPISNSAGGLSSSWINAIVVLVIVACGIVGVFVYAHFHPEGYAKAEEPSATSVDT